MQQVDTSEGRDNRLSRVIAVCLTLFMCLGLFYLADTTQGVNLLALRYDPYAILSGASLLAGLGLFAYFVSKPARTEERVWLTIYMASACVYTLGEFLQRLSDNRPAAIFWVTLEAASALLAPATYLFALAYTSRSERRYPGVDAALMAGALIVVFFMSYTNVVFNNNPSAAIASPWGFVNMPQTGDYVFIVWWLGLYTLAVIRLIKFRRHTRNHILRRQSLIFIAAVSIPAFVASFTDGVLPALGVLSIPPLAGTLNIIGEALLVYGVVRYQLLTINPTVFSSTVLGIIEESVVVTDEAFNVVFLNQKAEDVLGVKTGTSEKVSLETFIAPEDRGAFQKAFAADTGSQAVKISQLNMLQPSGPTTPVRVTSSYLQVGSYQMRVMILTDIADELHTQRIIEHEVTVRTEQLHKARAYLVESINSLEQGFILSDAHAKVELMNGKAARLFGAKPDGLMGVSLAELIPKLNWNADIEGTVRKVLTARQHRSLNVATPDGSFYKVYVTPVLADGRELGTTILLEDVTEQKILDRSKDEFFSIASHELRTPLTAIRGNMSMLQDYYPDALKDESAKGLVTDSHKASVRLIEIVNDFLDSSRLEQGKILFTIAPVPIQKVVDGVQSDLKTLAEEHHNTISTEGFDQSQTVMADESRLRQIIYNLVSNAVKYTEQGAIKVTGKVDAAHHTFQLRVSDTGKGIPPEGQKLLFRKFQQAGDPLTRDDTKGTGLGLYIARLLAKNMKGTIALESTEVGKGSTFLLTMPLADKTAK